MNFKKLIKSDSRFAEIIRFSLVGGFATVFQYAIYIVFVHAVKLPAVVSNLISYAISFCANYVLSIYFTFRSKPTATNGTGFLLSHLFNMGLQTGLVAIFKEIVGKTWALLPAMAICFPVNFFLVRFVFKNENFKKKLDGYFHRKRKKDLEMREDALIDSIGEQSAENKGL